MVPSHFIWNFFFYSLRLWKCMGTQKFTGMWFNKQEILVNFYPASVSTTFSIKFVFKAKVTNNVFWSISPFEMYHLYITFKFFFFYFFFFNKIFQRKRGIQDTKTCRKCKLQGICAELENKVLLQTILDKRLKVNIRD